MAAAPVFYFDISSPYSYLAAERIGGLFAEAGAPQPDWVPISFGFMIQALDKKVWSISPEGPDPKDLAEIQRRAGERGLPEVLYPEGWPDKNYSLMPIRAATYAKESGRIVAFTQAAFRQQFAAGRDLSQLDNVLIAAAACELHPKAVTKALETRSIGEKLKTATNDAIARGVTGVPTVAVGEELFWGDDRLEEAAAAAAAP